MKRLVNTLLVVVVLLGISGTAYAFDPFEDYTYVTLYPLLQEDNAITYTVSSTEGSGYLAEVIFEPWESGTWNLRVWNITYTDCLEEPNVAAVEYAWKDINNGNTWNVWTTELISCPTYSDTELYSGSAGIAYRIRMSSIDPDYWASKLRLLVTPK